MPVPFLPNDTAYCRFTGQAFAVVSCDGAIAVLRWAGDPDGETSSRIVGDITKQPPHRRVLLPVGKCACCDANRADEMMPPHDASLRCESGHRAHCTCDTCF